MKFLALFVLTVGTYVVSADEHGWKYEGESGPDYWGNLKIAKNQCGLKAQSPIDIDVPKVTYDKNMKRLVISNKDVLTPNVTILNTGHSIQLNSPNYVQTVSGGPLDGTFKLLQMHFHWGKDSYRGSEHTVNGRRYPLELHMVHAHESGALAVVGIFFDLTKGASDSGLAPITQVIKDMKTHASVDIPGLVPGTLLPANTADYFTYQGSLTTPPCSEVVTWLVLKDVKKVNETDLQTFRSTKFEDDTSMCDNFRPVQLLNNRPVRSSFATGSASSTSASTMLSTLPFMILSSLFCK